MSELERIQRDYRLSLPDKGGELRRAWDALCDEDASAAQVDHLHLLLHRLAGSAGTYGYERIAALARALEQDWVRWKAADDPRLPTYRVCAAQAGTMAELLDALLSESQDHA